MTKRLQTLYQPKATTLTCNLVRMVALGLILKYPSFDYFPFSNNYLRVEGNQYLTNTSRLMLGLSAPRYIIIQVQGNQY